MANEQENTKPTALVQEPAPIVDVATLNQALPEDYAEKKVEEETAADEGKEGGTGSNYSVPIGSYQEFKNVVNGNGYDIDNYYGWQCWDGTALLWQQLGRSLLTGNGLAIGCWDLKRDTNKGDQFDLVGDVNSLRLGDVVVMRPNHIGFFDGYEGGYMRILGQNQGGAHGPQGGMAFNIVRISKSSFAGAFRYKAWQVAEPSKSNEEIAAQVMAGKWGNGDDRRNRLQAAGYDYAAIQAIVNGQVGNPSAPRKSNEVIADEVIAGAWGNGEDRQNRLTAAGYDYNAVQAIVNSRVSVPAKLPDDQVADQVIAGAWGNGDDRRNRLVAAGYDYNNVQSIVNQKLAKNSVGKASDDEVANQVIHGDWGNGQERRDRLAAAGYDYGTIQGIVNRKLGL